MYGIDNLQKPSLHQARYVLDCLSLPWYKIIHTPCSHRGFCIANEHFCMAFICAHSFPLYSAPHMSFQAPFIKTLLDQNIFWIPTQKYTSIIGLGTRISFEFYHWQLLGCSQALMWWYFVGFRGSIPQNPQTNQEIPHFPWSIPSTYALWWTLW